MIKELKKLKNIFRPRYKRLVRGALPRNSCDGLNPVPMEKLYYYSLLYPEKLEQVGEYLYIRASKLLRRGRVGHVALTMDALAQLLRTAPPVHREALVDPFLRTAMLCLQSHVPRLQVTATYAFIHFVILKDETLYHHNYEQLLREFAEMCNDKHENLAVQEEVRHAGIQGLEALLMWCDELLDDIYSPATMAIILPCLLFNFNDPEYLSMSYAERQKHSMTPPGIAESCLREYVARTSPSRVHFVLTPMLRYLDEHDLWEDELLPFELFKVVMLSVEAPYAFYLIERLVEHASPVVTADAHTRARVLEVVIVITEAATDEAVGPAAFYCVGRLLQDLVVAVKHFHGVHENIASDVEEYYQDTLVRALEAIAMTLPDYYKLEMLVLVMQHVPIPVRDMRDVWLRYLLLDIVDEVSQQYRSLYLTTALPAQLLRPLLQLSLSPNPRVRLSVHATLQNLVDRRNNAPRLREPHKAMTTSDVQRGPTSPLDAAFVRRFGLEIFHALHEGFAVFNNSRRNLRAVFTTSALIIVEAISEATMIEALRFIINIEELVQQGTEQNVRWRGELHACALALSRLLVLVAPCAQSPLAALDVLAASATSTMVKTSAPVSRTCCYSKVGRGAPCAGTTSTPKDVALRLAAMHAILGMSWTPAVRALLIRKRVMEALRNDGWQGVTQHHLAPYSIEVTRPVAVATALVKEHPLDNYPIAPLTPNVIPVSFSPESPEETERDMQKECQHVTKDRKQSQLQPPDWGTRGGPVQWERANVTTVMLLTSTTTNMTADPPNTANQASRSVCPSPGTSTPSPPPAAAAPGLSRVSSGLVSNSAILRRTFSVRSHQSGMLTLRESHHTPLTPPRAPRTLESEERWDFLKEVLMLGDAAIVPPEGASRSTMNMLTHEAQGSQYSLTSTTSSSTSTLTESPAVSRPPSPHRKGTSLSKGKITPTKPTKHKRKKASGELEDEIPDEIGGDDISSRGLSPNLSVRSSSTTSTELSGEEAIPRSPSHHRLSRTRRRSSTDSGRSAPRSRRASIVSADERRGRSRSALRGTRSLGDTPRSSASHILEELRRASGSRQRTDKEQVPSIPKAGSADSGQSVGDKPGELIGADKRRRLSDRRIRRLKQKDTAGTTTSTGSAGAAGAWRRSWAEGIRHHRGRPVTEAAAATTAPGSASLAEGGAESSGGGGDRRTGATQQPLVGSGETGAHSHRHFSVSSGYSSWGMSMSRNRTSLLDTIAMRMRTEAAVASTEARFQFTEEQERLRRRFAERPFEELHAPSSPLERQSGALSDMVSKLLATVKPPTPPLAPYQPIILPKSLRHFVYEGSQSVEDDEEVMKTPESREASLPGIRSPSYKAAGNAPFVAPYAVLDLSAEPSESRSNMSEEPKSIAREGTAKNDQRQKKKIEPPSSGDDETNVNPTVLYTSPSLSATTSFSSGRWEYPNITSPSIGSDYSTGDTILPVQSVGAGGIVLPPGRISPCLKHHTIDPKAQVRCTCSIPRKDLPMKRDDVVRACWAPKEAMESTSVITTHSSEEAIASELAMDYLKNTTDTRTLLNQDEKNSENEYNSKERKCYEGNYAKEKILRPCEIRLFGKKNCKKNTDVHFGNERSSTNESPSEPSTGVNKHGEPCEVSKTIEENTEISGGKIQKSSCTTATNTNCSFGQSESIVASEAINRLHDDPNQHSKDNNDSASEFTSKGN